MYEILEHLPIGALVLDLGCRRGSFPSSRTAGTVIRLDRQIDSVAPGELAVRADAASLPFAGASMRAVVANHSLEHFDDLSACLREIGRVIQPGGSLFISVPDASTITDKLYRWLSRGGGHVNAFVAPEQILRAVEQATGLKHVATRTLCSSLSFLSRRNSPRPRPRRLLLLGGGFDWSLRLYTWLSRRIDRVFHLRASVYGWAFYFGDVPGPIDTATRCNVCIQCGGAAPAASLTVRRTWFGIRLYNCPSCGTRNVYASDR